MTAKDFSNDNLGKLYQRVPVRPLSDNDKIVIFSDLHMGNGSGTDDFVHNAEMFTEVLRRYYVPNKFHLILNGDVEDLQRYPMRSIVRRWPDVYNALASVVSSGGLTRIVGNHDLELVEGGPAVSGLAIHGWQSWPETFTTPIEEGLRLQHSSGELFVFHGHQTSRRYEEHNNKVRLVLRYLANPLRIGNFTVAADSTRRFKTERRAYEFTSSRKILGIIGHTHRPLFESMSKNDAIQFEIERLCRKYPKSKKQHRIEDRISVLKEDLRILRAEEKKNRDSTSLYREHLLVPSLFNSGCVLGKRGMTNLEIEKGAIRLVYWFDRSIKQKRMQYRVETGKQLEDTPFSRLVINEESLEYIFSRIRLLA